MPARESPYLTDGEIEAEGHNPSLQAPELKASALVAGQWVPGRATRQPRSWLSLGSQAHFARPGWGLAGWAARKRSRSRRVLV